MRSANLKTHRKDFVPKTARGTSSRKISKSPSAKYQKLEASTPALYTFGSTSSSFSSDSEIKIASSNNMNFSNLNKTAWMTDNSTKINDLR